MTIRSLKSVHESKSLRDLTEWTRRLDERALLEQRSARLLVEVMDDEDLAKVDSIIQKLTTIKGKLDNVNKLPTLRKAIETAEAELNKYTGGGVLTKAWAKLKNKVGIDNPVVKIATFADALERGFSQAPQILKNNGVDLTKSDPKKSLVQVLGRVPTAKPNKPNTNGGAKSDAELATPGGTSSPENYSVPAPSEGLQLEAPDDQASVTTKIKNITAQLQKAIAPGGLFGAFKKIPYVDTQALAQELVRTPLGVFSDIANEISAGAKAADVATDLKDQLTQAGNQQTASTQKGAPTQPTSQTSTSEPAKPTTGSTGTTATGAAPASPRGGGSQQNYAAGKQKLIDLNKQLAGGPDFWNAMAKKLVDSGWDPSKL